MYPLLKRGTKKGNSRNCSLSYKYWIKNFCAACTRSFSPASWAKQKDRQLRMDAVLLKIFLQALHTGYAVIAIRGVADKLVVELADTDETGTFFTASRSTS